MILIHLQVMGQTGCDCPPVNECSACQGGGLTSLTFRYRGSLLGILVTVSDGGGVLFTGTLVDGSVFTVTSSQGAGQLFVNNKLTLNETLLGNTVINTPCASPVFVGDVFGNFTVIAGKSFGGTPICCSAEDMETTPPVISNCPTGITASTSSTECFARPVWTAPTVSDNCGNATLTSTHNPGDVFYPGTTEVVYTAIDDYGNTSSCSFNVVVKDDTPPVIANCPDITVTLSDTECSMQVSWSLPNVSDNCPTGLTLTSDISPGEDFPLGTTPVTYTATDAAGNKTTCTFNVIVNDVTTPVITDCPTDITVTLDDDKCAMPVNWIPPGVTDNCTDGLTITSPHSPNDLFPVGTTLVTYTATDGSGNETTCTFNVIVNDLTKPVITDCPTDITVTLDDDKCAMPVNWTPPGVTDNCIDELSMTSDYSPNDPFPVGTTLVTYTATDASGNKTTCTFNVIVNDVTKPVITDCPTDITVTLADDACETRVNWTPPNVSDNCTDGLTLTSPHSPNDPFPVGTTQVIYTATDASGNKTTCTFNVIVNDLTKPVITDCPTDITVTLADNACTMPVSWTPPNVSDNCTDGLTMISDYSPNDPFPVGTTPVTYTATDGSGNQTTCSFNVIVKDVTSPVISNCPANITITLSSTTCSLPVSWTPPGVTDNCSDGLNMTSNINPGEIFYAGTTTVTYTAIDGAGNTSTCTFKVTVNDNTTPQIAGCNPAAIIEVTANESCAATASWPLPTVTDNCPVTLTSTHTPGDLFAFGKTTVTYTATDNSGNTSTCKFNVLVKDKTAPVITGCPASDIVVTTTASCNATVNWTPPTASDNCSVTLTSTHHPGDAFPPGTTQVIYTATDGSANITTCSFNVIVQDNSAPVITGCPTSDIVTTTGATCSAVVNWTPPTTIDNCTVTLTSTHNPGDSFPPGTTQVIYTATDPSQNVSTCSFNIIVEDGTAPVITGCPADLTVSTSASCEAVANWVAPTVSDNCGPATITSTHTPGHPFPIGTTDVTYTATDNKGNSSSCSFKVTVEDHTPPVFSNCLTQITVNADATCHAAVTWAPPSVADNCAIASITSSHNPGDIFPKGTTEVTYTATDIYGNVSSCTFPVIITNQHPPVISGCPDNITIKAGDSGQAQAHWALPTITIACGEVTLMSSHAPGDFFPIGSTEVEYKAIDPEGNSSTCVFTVNVSYEEVDFNVVPVITPDGDGINDEWILGNIEKFQENKVVIVDRWGSVIFSAKGYNNEGIVWKGTNTSGTPVPTGTYFYTITVRIGPDVRQKTGFVELIQ